MTATLPMQQYSRTRSSGALVKGVDFVEVASGLAANSTTVLGYGAAHGEKAVMSDVVTPRFKEILANGGVLFKPMQRVVTEHRAAGSSSGSFVQVTPSYLAGQTYTSSGDWISFLRCGQTPPLDEIPGDLSPKALVPATTADRAISEACTKAQRLPSDANLLVTLAEMHKTMRLVPDLWTNWAAFFQSFNSKVGRLYGKHLQANPGHQAKQNLLALQRIADTTWLAMRFGVRPLIMDTMGVMKALNAELNSQPVRQAVRGESSVSGSEVSSWQHNYGISRSTIVSSYTHNVSVRAMSLIEIQIESFARKVGLSIGQVPEAVIDLVSFSFVVNWMVTLNDFVSAIGRTYQPGMHMLGGCYTVSDEKLGVYQLTDCVCTNSNFTLGSSPTGTSTVSVLTKYRVPGLVAPSLSIRADPFKFLRDFRLLDAVALLSVQTRRLKMAGLVRPPK